jgi:Chaperone of endosialidase
MRLSRTMIVLFVLGALSTMALAAVPTTASYQGRLTTSAGAPVPNGTYSVRFSLWSAPTMGTESWSETQMVTVSEGLFSTELGSISGGFFDISVCPPYCDAWLQIEVTISGSVSVMSPRTHLAATPWSLVSRSLYNETSSGAYITKVSQKGGEDGSVTQDMEADADGDGHADYSLNDTVSITSASRRLGHDSDDDGTLDNTVDMSVTPTTSSVAINTKGTGADKGRTISSTTYPDSAVQILSSDEDGDGIAEIDVTLTNVPGSGTATPKGRVATSHDSDDDGTPNNTAEMIVTPTTSSVAINTKGTGADKNRIVSTTTPDSVIHELLYDDDQVGSELTVLYRAKAGKTGSTKRCAAVTPTDSSSSDEYQTPDSLNEEVSITGGGGAGGTFLYGAKTGKTGRAKRCETFDASARSLTTELQTPDSTVDESSFYSSGSLRLNYKAKQGSSGSTKRCAFTGPSSSSGIDEDCDDLHSTIFMSHSSGGNNHSSDVSCDASRSSMQFSSSNLIGTGTALTLQTDVGGIVNPIEHSSGAHLTAGGDWTNASDKNLKENFEKVDGSEILEKIEDLPISEWNYKTEGDDAKHIGPTAQDFSNTFGLGGNNKTISTIDPSGVALVAIKELTKQNKELKRKNSELESKLNDLQKQIEKLASSMKK